MSDEPRAAAGPADTLPSNPAEPVAPDLQAAVQQVASAAPTPPEVEAAPPAPVEKVPPTPSQPVRRVKARRLTREER